MKSWFWHLNKSVVLRDGSQIGELMEDKAIMKWNADRCQNEPSVLKLSTPSRGTTHSTARSWRALTDGWMVFKGVDYKDSAQVNSAKSLIGCECNNIHTSVSWLHWYIHQTPSSSYKISFYSFWRRRGDILQYNEHHQPHQSTSRNKAVVGEYFYRLEGEEEGRAGQSEISLILWFCCLLLHLRGLNPQMCAVVLRLIVPAPLTAFEEPALGNRSPQGGGGERNTVGNEKKKGI